MKLVLATRNKHKLEEIQAIFNFKALEISSAFDYPEIPDVEEDGDTLEANAIKKAVTLAKALNCWAMADDSGLEVAALNGAPGVYSARFAGPSADDAANNALLLNELADVPDARRTAHYACHMTLAAADGSVVATSSGQCHGRIDRKAHGGGGFGYDPLFLVPEYHRSFGEIAAEVKAMISHRGRALRAMVDCLRRHH